MGFVGSNLDMKYGGNKSGAQTEDLVDFFNSLGIGCSYEGYNSSKVLNSLNLGIPVIARADATKREHRFIIKWYTDYKNGHAWIIDGYEKQRRKYIYHYTWMSFEDSDNPQLRPLKSTNLRPALPNTKISTSISSTTYLRMNWGWNGSSDNAMYSLNNDWETASGSNFQYRRSMIIGFRKR
jgi:hypothetical protein